MSRPPSRWAHGGGSRRDRRGRKVPESSSEHAVVGGRRAPGCALALLAAIALLPGALTAEPAASEERRETAVAEVAHGPLIEVRERLTVTATRLRDEPGEELRTPAHVTVLTRDSIERTGAATLQELLAGEAGVVLYDQVGNGVSRTFDLRGFSGGTGTRVYLDGAPLNEPRNNGLSLELVPVGALERIEITRGSTAALAGGGAEAGVINLWTRAGESLGGRISLAAGDFDTFEGEGQLWSRGGLFLAGSWLESEGFRRNAGGELGRLGGSLGRDLGAGRRLQLSLLSGSAELGAPGALTLEELAADPGQSPFNRLDFSEESVDQAALNFNGALAADLSLSANVFYRERDSEILTTGRAAPLFGGFALDSEASVKGSTVQLGRSWQAGSVSHRLSVGIEWLDGETDARGWFTSADDPGRVDSSGLGSDNTALRETLGIFAQSLLHLGPRWSLLVGARYDRDEVGYRERLPAVGKGDARTFSELSLRAGASWAPNGRVSVYLSAGEAFLPPTVEELFSFPLFGSNPDLEPEDSSSWELGVKGRWASGLDGDLAFFVIDTEDEIVFDPDSPRGLFGANVNAGRARRSGVEASLRGRATSRLSLFANLTLLEAEIRSGAHRGNDLPLVPAERLAGGLELELGGGFELAARGLYVGEQTLDNDDANSQAKLDSYAVVDARLSWSPRRGEPGRGGAELFVEASNLFDERYATRGIYAFDFSSSRNDVFLTPAPGRRVMVGLEWGL